MEIQLNKVEVPNGTASEVLSASVVVGATGTEIPTTTQVSIDYDSLSTGEKATVDAFVTLLKNKTA